MSRLVSRCLDGASVNLGEKAGVVALLKKENPAVIGVHAAAHLTELAWADAVKEQFHYLEPHLRASVGKVRGVHVCTHPSPWSAFFAESRVSVAPQVMIRLHEAYAADKDFHVSFFNLPHLCAIRELRTDKIGALASFSGTVTRTTDVRPELLHGVFQCELCQFVNPYAVIEFFHVEQDCCDLIAIGNGDFVVCQC